MIYSDNEDAHICESCYAEFVVEQFGNLENPDEEEVLFCPFCGHSFEDDEDEEEEEDDEDRYDRE